MSKAFKDISTEECFNLFEEMIKNSDIRWSSGLLLAQNKDYGGAINNHITSMEEMIKAIIMILDSKDFEFRKVEGMELIIRRSHSIRHLIAFILFVMNVFMDDLKRILLKLKKDPSSILEYNENREKLELFIKMYSLRKLVLIKKELHWFSKVESFRQEGNYVDFDIIIKSPLKIEEKDYYEVFKRLDNVRKFGKEFIETYKSSDTELKKLIDNLKTQFKKDDFYFKIEKTISSIKKERKSPFALLKKYFEIED